jgi:hypothetical protein
MHQQLYETTRDTSLNDGLDLIVGSIRKVRDRPAGVNKNFVIQRVNQLGQDG